MKYYRHWLRDLTISSVKLQEVLFVGTRTVPLVRSGRYIQYKLWVETDIHRELLKVIHDQARVVFLWAPLVWSTYLRLPSRVHKITSRQTPPE